MVTRKRSAAGLNMSEAPSTFRTVPSLQHSGPQQDGFVAIGVYVAAPLDQALYHSLYILCDFGQTSV